MSWLWLVLAASPVSWAELDEAGRTSTLDAYRSMAPEARLTNISAKFLKTPYVVSPLGEGEGFDPDPRIRFDAVDCLTFVEETMALCLSSGGDQVVKTLDQIRYADKVGYGDRNHVMEAQWLPNNLKKGFLTDVTKKYGGESTVHVTKILDDAAWKSKSGSSLKLLPSQQAHGEFGIDIIPAAKALGVLDGVPEGTVVVVVRADRPTLVTRITHVGFLIHGPKGPALRHASRTFGKVVDEPLASYLHRNLGYAKWTVDGFSLYQVTAPTLPAAAP